MTVGAQLQNGHTVLGLAADIDWGNITGSSSGTVNFNGAPIGTATLSSTLSSGTGAFNSPPCISQSELHIGLAAGAGIEYGITQNLSAKGEWIWVVAGAGNTLKDINWRFGM